MSADCVSETATATLWYPDDDTVGNTLNVYLLEHENVLFSAYKNPEPNERTVEVRIVTDGTSVEQVVDDAVACIKTDIAQLETAFKKAL